jgi:hypothetical protein
MNVWGRVVELGISGASSGALGAKKEITQLSAVLIYSKGFKMTA